MSLVGRQIGHYRILEQLGSGGMSVVYKGLDLSLDREVAIKVLHPHLSSNAEAKERLSREAKAVARLHHPNILEVFEFSAEPEPLAGGAYIVTEYIRGKTLREFLSTESFSPPEVAGLIICEVAAALAHAHRAGIIHRDLKPENIMVRSDGVVKLMDFGIAKMIDREHQMTMTGALVGSPSHMAPEIIEGNEATCPSDIFSLGTMFYLFSTGKLPFEGATATATLKKIVDGNYEDPRKCSGTLSDELAEIIVRCLSRNPRDRYASATELQEALARHLAGLGLEHPAHELAHFFADPKGYRARLIERLVEVWSRLAQQYIENNHPAKAMSVLNQLLAYQPKHALGLQLIERLRQAGRRRMAVRRRNRLLGIFAGALTLGGVIWALPKRPREAARTVAQPGPSPAPAAQGPRASNGPEASQPPAPTRPPEPKPALVPVTILVRPFGFVKVDGAAETPTELSAHTFQLSEGRHQIKAWCHFCEEVTRTIEVRRNDGQQFAIAPPLRPSRLTFNFEPPEAIVRIGGQQKMAKDTQSNPFIVKAAQGPRPGRHHVQYEVSMPGYQTVRGSADVEAGGEMKLQGRLSPE